MSEAEKLQKEKEEISEQQEIFQIWIPLKKNIQQRVKNPADAFRLLKKPDVEVLHINDFQPYAQGLDITKLFKGQQITEDVFANAWENWEFKYGSNQHTLQMIDEKLELIGILDQKEKKNLPTDGQSKKKILSQLQNCEDLDSLQKKLDAIVANAQQQQPPQLAPNENDCFSQFLGKKSEVKSSELYISKIKGHDGAQQQPQQQQQGQLVESQIISIGKMTGPAKKSYIDGSISIQRNKGSNPGFSVQAKPLYSLELQKQTSPRFQQAIEVPRSSPSYFRNTPPPRPTTFEENDQVRRSQKSKRMKNDLQHYIQELFQGDRDYRPTYQDRPESKGLAGFPIKKYFNHGSSAPPSKDSDYASGNSGNNVQRRVSNIRSKLNDFAQAKLQRKVSPSRARPPIEPSWTPNPNRSSSIPKKPAQKQSPYTPGNTHRLNLDRLKQEKEQLEQELHSTQNNKEEKRDNQKPENDPAQRQMP